MRLVFSRPGALVGLVIGLLTVVPATASAATPSEVEAAQASAVQWIRAQQDPVSGRINGFGGDWAATALAAAGVDAADLRVAPGDPSLQDDLLDEYTSGEWIEPPGTGPFPQPVTDYGRATLVSYAAGLDPARLSAQQNMPAQIAALWNPATGSFGEASSNGTAFAILALARTPLPGWALQPAVAYLRRNQHDDGGWEFGPATTPTQKEAQSTAEMTGAAIAAFCEAGVPAYDPQVAEGIEFLQAALAENSAEDGGFEYPFGGPNVDSNAWAISGLTACGVDPQGAEWTTGLGRTPVDYVLSQQVVSGPEKGSFESFGSPSLYSSQDALRAISGGVFTATPPSFRAPPAVAAGAPVPHLLALELGPGNVRFCKVTAPAGASLPALLDAAKSGSSPDGCVTSVGVSEGKVTSIDGVTPADEGEAWLVRRDAAPVEIAASQSIGFGELVALRPGAAATSTSQAPGPAGAPGAPGARGKQGKRGKQGRRGRHAHRGCRAKRKGHEHRAHCGAHHRRKPH